MDYSNMSENMLLKTIVEEELLRYEARYGKAVCQKAKEAYIKKIVRIVIVVLCVLFLLRVINGSKVISGLFNGLSRFYFIYILIAISIYERLRKSRKISLDIFQNSLNPIVSYVMTLAKKNPDTKIKDIIYTVCENTGNRSGVGSGNDYNGQYVNGQYDYEMQPGLKEIITPTQRRGRKTVRITIIVCLLLGILGIAGYYMIPHASYVDVDDGYMVQNYKLGFSVEGRAVIPDSYNGKPVVAINNGAFKGDPFIKTVELPDTIDHIGGEAFMNCRNLVSIRIPDGVTELRGNTFEGCTSLRNVELPDSIMEIHGECFVNCKSLQEIKLPPAITEIKGNTFEGCSSLRGIAIPRGVTRIGSHAFYGCSSLSAVSVPTTVESIGSSAFRKCDSLNEIKLPVGVNINERAFKDSPTMIAYYVPKE